MSSTYILCIDTATTICSVALGTSTQCVEPQGFEANDIDLIKKGSKIDNGANDNIQTTENQQFAQKCQLIGVEEISDSRAHSSMLTVLIERLLAKSRVTMSQLSAVAVNQGPGSYTGLRIGISTAKGICYAMGIPLIAIGSLEAMAHGICTKLQGLNLAPDALLCPMIDARRMEVYTALFDRQLRPVAPVEAKIIDRQSFGQWLNTRQILFFGDGATKCQDVIDNANALFTNDFQPSAADMLKKAQEALAAKQFVDTAYFEPLYLKDFVAIKGKNKVLDTR